MSEEKKQELKKYQKQIERQKSLEIINKSIYLDKMTEIKAKNKTFLPCHSRLVNMSVK